VPVTAIARITNAKYDLDFDHHLEYHGGVGGTFCSVAAGSVFFGGTLGVVFLFRGGLDTLAGSSLTIVSLTIVFSRVSSTVRLARGAFLGATDASGADAFISAGAGSATGFVTDSEAVGNFTGAGTLKLVSVFAVSFVTFLFAIYLPFLLWPIKAGFFVLFC
jgi:hypothetical protein